MINKFEVKCKLKKDYKKSLDYIKSRLPRYKKYNYSTTILLLIILSENSIIRMCLSVEEHEYKYSFNRKVKKALKWIENVYWYY
ncbi:hypothetical protein JYT36_00205 [Bacteroidales bacterium AH-315-N07]|nr:hypothetical protein [Bacteroidales bacterium AH-315-N07]